MLLLESEYYAFLNIWTNGGSTRQRLIDRAVFCRSFSHAMDSFCTC
ncbi:unnamed protein product [Acanthoscelides obtectus]|uniref:Uncharacterized protein n=1 Tax=Acanthoscelides obtectus TaxID=200917 RepID=A0A9P0PH25_ACAOB|nr:unnamed protein product [Acanthoscelides obtectus]CAK1653095.1 hypothetical protein AOBTE_LOCUS18058 [Acanthoscelides obtectus]